MYNHAILLYECLPGVRDLVAFLSETNPLRGYIIILA
jgi:hypothetical protein